MSSPVPSLLQPRFCEFMRPYDQPELTDEAWWNLLYQGVVAYNAQHKTQVDPHIGIQTYLHWRNT